MWLRECCEVWVIVVFTFFKIFKILLHHEFTLTLLRPRCHT